MELTHKKKSGKSGLFFIAILISAQHSSLLAMAEEKSAEKSSPIKTMVVLVMENRSFDHMLGWLKRLNPEIDGLTGQEFNPLNTADSDSEKVFVTDKAEFVDPDPGHSFQAIREQVFGSNDTSADPPPMNGFAQQAESMIEGFSKRIMSGFRPELVPSYTALAMEFAICDRYFASIPTSTQPNRLYVHSATSHGLISNVKNALVAGFPQKTIFESMDEAGYSFGIYYQNIPATLFFKNLRKIKYIGRFMEYGFFKRHAKAGKLPNYVVIEQRYYDTKITPANDDHPSHDVAEGQKLVKEIYETLRSSPQWNQTLFVITYDEHGGFFDHVPTPVRNVPNPDNLRGADEGHFNFDRLGVRVPALLISPWIEKGTVLHEPEGPTPYSQFEHSSIAATARKIFKLGAPLTKRDEWAGSFDSIITRTTPRTDCPEELPTVPWSLRHSPPDEENRKLTEFQIELVQLASQLNGDHTHKDYPLIGAKMSVKEANSYVQEAVAGFVSSACQAFKQGLAQESTTWHIESSAQLKNRKFGSHSHNSIQDCLLFDP